MESHIDNDSRIAEQAFHWFGVLPHAGPQERAAFASWLKESPRHVGEFLMVTAVHRHYADLDRDRRIDVEALLAQETPNVVPLKEIPLPLPQGLRAQETLVPTLSEEPKRWGRLVGTAAAVLAIALGAHWMFFGGSGSTGWQSYETRTGEVRSLKLEDGSTAHLNTQSRVEVRFARQSREVRLLAGEVLFDVKHNPARPFHVYAGPAVIEALGTQFDVYRHARNTKVSVLEGQVQISTEAPARQLAKLGAGEAADVTAGGHLIPLPRADTVKVTEWREHRLIFSDDTLADVVAEFNRYNRVPQFRIKDAATAQERITGVFDADKPESFILALNALDMEVDRTNTDEAIIRKR